MPVTVARQETYRCDFPECEQTYPRTAAVDGSYCSRECAARHRGRRFLADIRQDHRWCWSCWYQRKQIEAPTAETRRRLDGPIIREALVGYEYPTEHVDRGPYGLACQCGAVDHDIEDWVRRDGRERELLADLVAITREEGQHEYRFDGDRFEMIYGETDDLELAVGAALS